jgi:hypothetical protein
MVLLALLAAALAPPVVLAHSHKRKGLEVVHPWTPAMLERGATTTTIYMTIKSGRDDRLIGATTTLATKVELHEPAGDGAAGDSKAVPAVAITAGKPVELSRKGPRLVVSGVKRPLNAYDSFKLTLVFEKAGRMVVEVTVEENEDVVPHK